MLKFNEVFDEEKSKTLDFELAGQICSHNPVTVVFILQ